MNENEKSQIHTDYLKSWVTATLAFVGGEVTLLNTVYRESEYLSVLYLPILIVMLAILFCLAAFEGIVNRAIDMTEFNNRILKFWVKSLPITKEAIWLLSAIGGAFIAIGTVLAAIFIYIAQIST